MYTFIRKNFLLNQEYLQKNKLKRWWTRKVELFSPKSDAICLYLIKYIDTKVTANLGENKHKELDRNNFNMSGIFLLELP